jgi:hypothetical protein
LKATSEVLHNFIKYYFNDHIKEDGVGWACSAYRFMIYKNKSKAVPLHAMEALGGEEL